MALSVSTHLTMIFPAGPTRLCRDLSCSGEDVALSRAARGTKVHFFYAHRNLQLLEARAFSLARESRVAGAADTEPVHQWRQQPSRRHAIQRAAECQGPARTAGALQELSSKHSPRQCLTYGVRKELVGELSSRVMGWLNKCLCRALRPPSEPSVKAIAYARPSKIPWERVLCGHETD
eukprot:8668278-Pyramimonas_sp.AAC.1